MKGIALAFPTDPRLPIGAAPGWPAQLNARLYELFREVAKEVNVPVSLSAPASPGRFLGDFVKNANDYVELGTSPNKYTLKGWIWNGTIWIQQRFLTGN